MSLKTILRTPAELFYGWRMIAIGSVLRLLGGGLHFYGFTVFFLPLSQDLGLSRAATSLAFSLARAEGAVEGPLVGYLIDRLGPRPIMLTAVIMSGLGYMLLSAVDSYVTFLLVYIGIISLSFGAGFMHCPMVLANTWFIQRRAMAMAVISGSIGLGGALISPLLAIGVHAWGWRPAALAAGLGFLVVGTPMVSTVRRSPESMGLLPDGAPRSGPMDSNPHEGVSTGRSEREMDVALPRAIRTLAFWLVILSTTIRTTGLTTMMVHFIPLMVWKGIDEQRAAFLLGALAFLALPAHLLFGWLADRVNKPRLMALTMIAATGALLLLIYGQEEWEIWLFLPLFAVVEALFPVTWATVGDLYGRKHFATIRGTMSFFYMWGGVVGPVVAGAIYDWHQSYSPTLWGLVVLFPVCALLYALLAKPWARSQSIS